MSEQTAVKQLLTRKQRVQVRLAELGKTKKQIALAAGLNYQHVCKIINGQVQPGLRAAEAIARELELPREEVLNS